MRSYLALAISVVSAVAGFTTAFADNFPTHSMEIVVPFPPGGNTDLLARLLAAGLQKSLKQSVVVVNRPGAGTNIGAELVAHSAPDGYTMLISAPASFVVNQFLYPSLDYDPDKSFSPVSLVAQFPNVLVVNPAVGVHTIQELIAKAKANRGKIAFASSGVGTTSHLAGMQFAEMAGINVLHVPYKGTSQSLQDLITDRVSYTIDNLGPILPFIKSGQLIALGVSTTKPVSLLPSVPPIASVLPGFSLSSWNVLAVPAGTPNDVVAKLSAASDAVLHQPEVMDKARSFGSQVVGGTPESVADFLKEERVRWQAAVKAAKLDENTFR